jgi:hypothetical protein
MNEMQNGSEVQAKRRRADKSGFLQVVQQHRPVLMLAGIVIALALAACYHYFIYLPQPDQPHRLALVDDVFALGVVVLIGLVGLALGMRLLRPFPLMSLSRLERGALALGIGWGILSLAVLALGLAGLLYSWLLIAGLMLGLMICWGELRRILMTISSGVSSHRIRPLFPTTRFEKFVALIVLVEMELIGTQVLVLPYTWPRGFDLYQYHWAVPKLYLLHHAIYALPGWAHANFPFNTEMLNTLALAFNSPIAAVLLQDVFGMLAIILIVCFLSRRVSKLAAWIGLALCLCNPMFAGLLTSGYAEMAVTYYCIASVVIVLLWMQQRRLAGGAGEMRLLFLAGLAGGFGLGAKYTEGQIVAGIALLLGGMWAIEVFQARRRRDRILPVLRLALSGAVTYGAALLLPLLPWLLKDWIFLGNPIYPFVWGGPEWDAARTEVGVVTLSHFGPRGPLPLQLLTGFFSPYTTNGDDPPLATPTYLLLAAPLLPLIWLAERTRHGQRGKTEPFLSPEASASSGHAMIWLVAAAGSYIAWVFSHAALARYGVPWLMLLPVPTSVVLARMFQVQWRKPFLRVIAQGVRGATPGLVLLLLVVLGPGSSFPFWVQAAPVPLLTGQVSLHQWEKQHLFDATYWAMINYVETHVPHDDRLLLLGRGTGYFLDGYDYVADSAEDWIPYLETEGRSPADMVALLQRDGFRYVIYDEVTLNFVIKTYENSYLASFVPAFRQFLADSLQQVWNYGTCRIYRVPSP